MGNDYKILKQITPENANPYSVPFGYFEGLVDAILLKINGRQETYRTPENYFNELSSSVFSKIKQQQNEIDRELQEIAPLLNSVSRENVYTAPLHYFEDNKFNESNATKVISFKKRTASLLKYSVAAALIGIVSFTGLKLLNKPSAIGNDLQASIQNISDNDLKNELDNDKFSVASIEETALVAPWQSLADLQEEIKYVSDEEMEVYINDNNIIDETSNSSNS